MPRQRTEGAVYAADHARSRRMRSLPLCSVRGSVKAVEYLSNRLRRRVRPIPQAIGAHACCECDPISFGVPFYVAQGHATILVLGLLKYHRLHSGGLAWQSICSK